MGYSQSKTIPKHWEIGEIENYLELIIDYRGKTPKKSSAGIRTLSARSVKNGRIDYSQAYFISEKTFEEWETRGKPKPGDVLLTTEGPLGEVAQLDTQRVALAQRLIGLRGKENELDNAYLKYYLISPIGKNELLSKASGTTVQGIKQSEFRKIKLIKPPYKEQIAIAGILSNLDAKIQLNQRMNCTLEAVGAAVFKRWFVDFEFPNEEGKPYKSSGGEMVPNEKLGKEIPKDWQVVEITEVVLIVDCLHSKKPHRTETGPLLLQVFNIDKIGYLDLSDPFSVSEEDYKYWTRNIEVKGGDCIITNAGRVGAIAQIPEGCHFGIGRNITAIRPNKISPTYLINYLQSEYGTDEIQKNVDSGTILDSLNVKGIIKIKILMPLQTILNNYDNLARPLRKRIEINNNQTFTLSQIRDRLLPKLMSGKIRVTITKKK